MSAYDGIFSITEIMSTAIFLAIFLISITSPLGIIPIIITTISYFQPKFIEQMLTIKYAYKPPDYVQM